MKRSFITGLIILLPIAITFLLISFLLDIFTSPFLEIANPILERLEKIIPILDSPELRTFISRIIIILFFFFAILILGILGRWFIFRSLLSLGNTALMKIPFFKSIYNTVKDIITSFLSVKERRAFKYPVMVEFPSKDSKCIGFLSGRVPKECLEATKEDLSPIFVPTAPHPISGYLIFVPKKNVLDIDMTNEEAIKFTVSCGIITPESIKEMKDDK